MVIAKEGRRYISGCRGDDDGHLFPVLTSDRRAAKRFANRKEFREWADELTDPISYEWYDYSNIEIVVG